MTLPHFRSVDELLASTAPDQPVMCFCPAAFRDEAERFAAGFPGDVHYAVKANPHPAVLNWLAEGGVDFDEPAEHGSSDLVVLSRALAEHAKKW